MPTRTMAAATSRSLRSARATGTGRPPRKAIDTVLTQLTVSMKTALRKPFSGNDLRRAGFSKRRGQDSNLRRTQCPHGFSKPALSTTQPPLRAAKKRHLDSSLQSGKMCVTPVLTPE